MKSISSFLLAKIALGVASSAVALGLLSPSATHALTLVDTELILSIDVSGSVSTNEFNLQKQGYVSAFSDPTTRNKIKSLPSGLAAALSYWASPNEQNLAVPWTLLNSDASIDSFRSAVSASSRPFSGSTAIGNAISFAQNQLLNNDFKGNRLVIDVSGDGESNAGTPVTAARNAAVAAGITINGLPIGDQALANYYQNNVIGGPGAFLVPANSFNDFNSAVSQKIGREVVPNPIPTPALLPGLIGLGLGVLRKRKAEAVGQANDA